MFQYNECRCDNEYEGKPLFEKNCFREEVSL